jgi:CRISPR system Cascade subunit CasB
MSDSDRHAERLLTFLKAKSDDRGLMADLRCGLVPGKALRSWPHLARFGGASDEHHGDVVRTVAGLFAQQAEGGRANANEDFGSTWRKFALAQDKDALDPKSSFSKHFMHLIAANREEVAERLIKLARRAGKDQSLGYLRLYDDLTFWGDRVKSRWASSFWGESVKASEEETADV